MSRDRVEIEFAGRRIPCPRGANLRRVLLDAGATPHNGAARAANCRGFGTCGTCAIEVDGDVSPTTRVERWRLGFPPHKRGSGLRLACQCRVEGDLRVRKHPGFWGQRIEPDESE